MKALPYKIVGDFFDQLATDSISTVFGGNPNALEKGDGLGGAAIGIFPYAYLGEPDWDIIGRRRNITSSFVVA